MFGNNKIFALEISDESIKFVQYFKDEEEISIGKYGEKNIPIGLIEQGEIVDMYACRDFFKSFQKEFKIKKAKIAIHLETDVENFQEKKEKIAKEYLSLFKYLDIDLLSIELKVHSLMKVVFKKDDIGANMILDFGDKKTGIHFVQNGEILSTQDIPFGLFQEIHNIADEINRHFIYWHTSKDEYNKPRPKIQKIVLVGGAGDITEFKEYLSTRMHQDIEISNVWQNIFPNEYFNTRIPEIPFEESLKYAPSIGLILE